MCNLEEQDLEEAIRIVENSNPKPKETMRKTKQLHLPTADLATAGAPLFEFAAGKKPEKKVNGSKKSKPLPEPIPDKPAINPVADQFQKCNSCEHAWKNQVGRTPIGWCTMHSKRPIPCSRYKFKPTEVKPEADPVTAIFGKPVYSYTRAQAIADGVMVDNSSLAKEAGFTAPVAMTRTVWDCYVEVPPSKRLPALVQLPKIPGKIHNPNRTAMTRTEKMSSRERVLAALNFQTPDRVPIDLGGNQTGIHKNAYRRLLSHLHIKEEITIMDAVQQLAKPSERILQRLHVDTRYISAGAPASWKGGIVESRRDGKLWHDLIDEFGVRWSMPEDAPYYMDITLNPLANATLDEIKQLPLAERRRRNPLCRLARPRLAPQERNPLRRRKRHFRGGLRDLLVHARLGTMVLRHDEHAGVLRGDARPNPQVLDGLVPRLPG